MNEKNVDALRIALAGAGQDFFREWGPRVHLDLSDERLSQSFAEYLAARGVLVPSALTDENCAQVGGIIAAVVRTGFAMGPHPAIHELERIARGES